MFTPLLHWLKNKPVPAFFVLTFAIAWSIWLPLGWLAPEKVLWALPGVWAPTVSAILLIGLSEGWEGVRGFVKQVLHWRIRLHWYLVVLFGVAAIAYLAIGVGLVFGIPAPELSLPDGLPREALLEALPILFLVNLLLGGPIAEDIGWRGYILPKLREHMDTWNTSLFIGIAWAIWHLPYFIFPGWRILVGDIPFIWFILLTTSWSVLFAWVYVNTGSILMPVFFHAAINTTLGTLGVLGQDNGSLVPLMLNTFLTWLIVAILLIVFGRDLKKGSAVRIKQNVEGISQIPGQ